LIKFEKDYQERLDKASIKGRYGKKNTRSPTIVMDNSKKPPSRVAKKGFTRMDPDFSMTQMRSLMTGEIDPLALEGEPEIVLFPSKDEEKLFEGIRDNAGNLDPRKVDFKVFEFCDGGRYDMRIVGKVLRAV
jgi:hypothetical protein